MPSNNVQKALIIGGGPTGLYAALKILEGVSSSTVKIIEKRATINRPQVVNTAYAPIYELPEAIKVRMWPDASMRENIFGEKTRDVPNFWPHADYKYLTILQIGELQKQIKSYIEETFSDRFTFEVNAELSVEDLEKEIKNYNLVMVATGNCKLNEDLRKSLKIYDLTVEGRQEVDSRAMYLIYQDENKEFFERNGKLLSVPDFAMAGLIYGHSNDENNDVQIYSYPVGELREIFAEMPESMKAKAAFPDSKLTFDGKMSDGSVLTDEEKYWFETYVDQMKKHSRDFSMPFPSDDKIKVYFATRTEFYYEKAATKMSGVPILFIGDAAGTTDFKLGISLGRGLLSVMHVTEEMVKHGNIAYEGVVDYHNADWAENIKTEFFQKNPRMPKLPEMAFKYFMYRRIVDGKKIDMEVRDEFIEEVRRIHAAAAAVTAQPAASIMQKAVKKVMESKSELSTVL